MLTFLFDHSLHDYYEHGFFFFFVFVLETQAPIGGKKKRTEAAVSDDEESSDEFLYKYGEDLLGDEDDRAYVAGLNEMDRELIMSERYEEREDAKERWNLLQKKKEKEKRAKEEAAASAAKVTRGRRKGKSENDKKQQAMEKLKARRNKTKKAQEEEEAAYEEEVEEEEADPYQDGGDDDDSADEWGGGGGGSKKKKKGGRSGRRDSVVGDDDDEEDGHTSDSDSGEGRSYGVAASLEEVQKVRLSRHRMEVWVHEPFFSDIVIGCFVRIGIGNGKDGNQVYKCAEIVDVEEGQVYTLGMTKTKKRIKLRHGAEAKFFKMASISNQDFTPQEFSRWKADMEDNDLRVTDDKSVARKVDELAKAKKKEHTNQDIQAILAEKRKVGITKGNSGARKRQLELEIDAFEVKRLDAEADEDELRANEFDQKIQEKIAEKEELMRVAEIRRQRRFGAGTALNVAKINQRNIGSNFGVRDTKAKAKAKATVVPSEDAAGLGPRRNSTQALNSTHADLDLDLDIDIDLPGTRR